MNDITLQFQNENAPWRWKERKHHAEHDTNLFSLLAEACSLAAFECPSLAATPTSLKITFRNLSIVMSAAVLILMSLSCKHLEKERKEIGEIQHNYNYNYN